MKNIINNNSSQQVISGSHILPNRHISLNTIQESDTNTNRNFLHTPDGSFIIIKYGNNEELIFNINCRLNMLFMNIRQRCKINEKDKVIDLCDLNGNLMNIKEKCLTTKYANSLFRSRQVFILIEVQNDTNSNTVKYVPLLNNNKELLSDNFMTKLTTAKSTSKKLTSKYASNRNGLENGGSNSDGVSSKKSSRSNSINSENSNRRRSIQSNSDKKKS